MCEAIAFGAAAAPCANARKLVTTSVPATRARSGMALRGCPVMRSVRAGEDRATFGPIMREKTRARQLRGVHAGQRLNPLGRRAPPFERGIELPLHRLELNAQALRLGHAVGSRVQFR